MPRQTLFSQIALGEDNTRLYADELPTQAGVDKLDKLRFRDFLREVYNLAYPNSPAEMHRVRL